MILLDVTCSIASDEFRWYFFWVNQFGDWVMGHDSPWHCCVPRGCPQMSSRWGADCTARPAGSTWRRCRLKRLTPSARVLFCEVWSVILTPRPEGCRSGAEPPRRRHSGACSRCSWRQGSLGCLQPPRLPSVGCSPSRPVQTHTVANVFGFVLLYFAKCC